MKNQYQVVSLKERRDLYEKQRLLTADAWPEFIRHDDVSAEFWTSLVESFEEFQLLLIDGDEILSIITTVPLRYDKKLSSLPDEGWDWVVRKSVEDFESHREPTLLAGIQIVINPDYQGMGLSYAAVSEMASFAGQRGFSQLIIPVRPSMKFKYPLISFDEYLNWRNDEGFSMDPWVRVHEKLGGALLHACPKAMSISGAIEEWEKWMGQGFPLSGKYVIDGGLVPLEVDRDMGTGRYLEPNVWVVHHVSQGYSERDAQGAAG